MNKKLVLSAIGAFTILLATSTSAFAKTFDSKTNVSLDHKWTVKFNKTLAADQDFSSISIQGDDGSSIPITVKAATDFKSITITPSDKYKANSTYVLTVDGIQDSDGEGLTDNATVSFTTANDNSSTTPSGNVTPSGSVTPQQAEQLVLQSYPTDYKVKCTGKVDAGFKIDGKASDQYYCVRLVDDNDEMIDGAFYVDSSTGTVYQNGSDGYIYRMSDGAFVGMYGDK